MWYTLTFNKESPGKAIFTFFTFADENTCITLIGQFQEQDGFVKCNKSALDKNLHVLYFDLSKGPMI